METLSVAKMVAAARATIRNLSVNDVAEVQRQQDIVILDIREPEERFTTGVIPGALEAPRGMLEFYADPASPYHRAELEPGRPVVVYCASGGRSALAAATLQQLGYLDVGHLDGGIKAWIAAGQSVAAAG